MDFALHQTAFRIPPAPARRDDGEMTGRFELIAKATESALYPRNPDNRVRTAERYIEIHDAFFHDGAPHLGQPCSHSLAISRVDQPSRLAAFQTVPNSSPASPAKTSSQESHSKTIRSYWRSIISSP
jgi:hypothetical protein